ncbi:protein-glutamine gamma-glutamyltransferase [Aneurinibacillus aneurinilyticus]|jgi:protein-glutamine gamma-glutamyltransferase|uniref:protein-glutamine gamma-glutamyltransferase n=1 Tax=Aneurinibacillus aneurinilyticus TaxID=1391 RepID=UPI0023F1D594|nr:protein-glutamine gamma-glutamyltransferase [Aneurinibacillus aneurinilyticus]MCI1696726.1 protein-glutamine gamma-glutamyltransferase [Aneurinibacillus aneurinilyticus]
MIQISDVSIHIGALEKEWPLSSIQRTILERMAMSPATYVYRSLDVLKFEVKMREFIVLAAKNLYYSGAGFATFKESRCNPRYWNLTKEGGFQLKTNVEPAEAINDIFRNGKKYAFECATAIVIVYYKATIDSIGKDNFNRLFPNILLYDGVYDEDLHLTWTKTVEYIPGDVQYFKNPEYNPKTPEWQGENVVLLEGNRYFAHGIGIKTKKEIIVELNNERKPGATVSAYLLEQAARPDFAYLSQYAEEDTEKRQIHSPAENRFTIAQIGSKTYIKI